MIETLTTNGEPIPADILDALDALDLPPSCQPFMDIFDELSEAREISVGMGPVVHQPIAVSERIALARACRMDPDEVRYVVRQLDRVYRAHHAPKPKAEA